MRVRHRKLVLWPDAMLLFGGSQIERDIDDHAVLPADHLAMAHPAKDAAPIATAFSHENGRLPRAGKGFFQAACATVLCYSRWNDFPHDLNGL